MTALLNSHLLWKRHLFTHIQDTENKYREERIKKKKEEALFLIQVVLFKLKMYIEPSKTVF